MEELFSNLGSIIWVLFVFIAPAIIGIFNKRRERKEEYEESDYNKEERIYDIESILGGKSIDHDKLKEQARSPQPVEKKKSPKKFKKPVAQPAQERVEVKIEKANDLEKTREIYASKIAPISDITSKPKRNKVRNKLSNLKEHVVWREILGEPRGIQPYPR